MDFELLYPQSKPEIFKMVRMRSAPDLDPKSVSPLARVRFEVFSSLRLR